MQRKSRLSLIFVFIGTLALVATACGKSKDSDSTGASGSPQKGGNLVDYYTFAAGDPASIDPSLAYETSGAQVVELMYDGLTAQDKDGNTIPWIAKRWEVSKDRLTYTFFLNDESKFSNGDEVKPSDFKYSWERALNPDLGSQLTYLFEPIKGATEMEDGKAKTLSGVVADDEAMTLSVTLAEPFGVFPTTLTHTAFSPLDSKVMNKLEDQSKFDQGIMIGNGPFVQSSKWQKSQQIVLKPASNYWGGPDDDLNPYIDTLTFKISADPDTAYAAFQAKQGLTGAIPPGKYTEATTKYKGTSDISPSMTVYEWDFNMKDPVVGGEKNLKLRQAIALSIDKDKINDDNWEGLRPIATSYTPPGIPGFNDDFPETIAGQSKPDLTEAKKLLGEWETENNKKASSLNLKLQYNDDGGHEKVAADIVDDLGQLGVKATQDPRNGDEYFGQMVEGQGQFFRLAWTGDFMAYDNFIAPLFGTDSASNSTFYSNKQVDDWIQEARSNPNQNQSVALYQKAEKQILDDVAVVPLAWYTNSLVWSPKLQDVHISPLQFVDYGRLWIKQ